MSSIRFDRRMSDQDALMWAIEKDPLLRSTMTGVTLLDKPPDRDLLRAHMERASREVPRLRQRVVAAPFSLAPPEFAIDRHFDLDYHLRWATAPGAGTLRDVLDMAAPFAMSGFDRARPLWEFMVVEGVGDGGAAMVQKLHHSVIDGVGAMKLSMAFLDTTPEGRDRGPLPDVPESERPSPVELARRAMQHELRRQTGILRRLPGQIAAAATRPGRTAAEVVNAATSAGRMLRPASEPLSPIMTGRSLSVRFDTLAASLSAMKAAAKAADGRLNDAFVAAVAGGLDRYHRKHGVDVSEVRMAMPINVRPTDGEVVAGNQFAPARFKIPLSIADPAERMRAIHGLVTQQRREPALKLLEPISGVLGRLPVSLTTGVIGSMMKAIDVTTSNVPGAPFPVYIAGARVEANYGYGPLAGSASNITLLSYLDEVHLAISTDPAAVPDPDLFVACLSDGLDEIQSLA